VTSAIPSRRRYRHSVPPRRARIARLGRRAVDPKHARVGGTTEKFTRFSERCRRLRRRRSAALLPLGRADDLVLRLRPVGVAARDTE